MEAPFISLTNGRLLRRVDGGIPALVDNDLRDFHNSLADRARNRDRYVGFPQAVSSPCLLATSRIVQCRGRRDVMGRCSVGSAASCRGVYDETIGYSAAHLPI